MKKQLLFIALLLFGIFTVNAQVLLQADFESGDLPAGWHISSNADDGGWVVGNPNQLSSQAFGVPDNGSSRMIGSNDDQCNCDKSADFLNLPRLDFTGLQVIVFSADVLYGAQSYQGDTESAEIAVSTDSVNWSTVAVFAGENGWNKQIFSLDDFAGEDSVYISIRYNDGGGWLYGIALDNIIIEVPPTLDAEFVELKDRRYGEVGSAFPISGKLNNLGFTEITSLEIAYSIDGGSQTIEQFENLSIPGFGSAEFAFASPWMPAAAGVVDVSVEILSVNGMTDENADNNTQSFETEIFDKVDVPNIIDDFLPFVPEFTEVAAASNQLDKPTDLDFFPILGLDEVWVINQRTENAGGSTLTITGASSDSPDFWHRIDGNAWHFMSLPTGIAFDPVSFFFANSPGVKDANHSGGTFTGPTLWTSDPDIYAMPSGGNGSHMDMLHGSPFSMGIAHEVDNVYWVFDDWHKDIVRYDFQEDHGPGNDYHGDAIVRRYKDIGIDADGDIPSHMVLDRSTGWMYVVDNGNDRVIRIDINSGEVGNSLPEINEPLAEHSQMVDFTVETVIDQGLDRPCGIEVMENRLLVSDYGTGDIIIFDMENGFAELGRFDTGSPGITGIKVGPQGNIWFTNRILNTLTKAEPGTVLDSEEQLLANQIRVSPNPTSGTVNISLPDFPGYPTLDLQLKDVTGRQIMEVKNITDNQSVDFGEIANGVYLVSIVAGDFIETRRIVVER